MTCDEFKLHIDQLFHSGSLPAEELALVDAHARGCPPCARFLEIARELPCREFIEFLDEYVEGRLDPARREVFERHLGICDDCQAYIESYRQTVRLTGDALRSGPPPLPEDLLKAILAARR